MKSEKKESVVGHVPFNNLKNQFLEDSNLIWWIILNADVYTEGVNMAENRLKQGFKGWMGSLVWRYHANFKRLKIDWFGCCQWYNSITSGE